MQESQIKEKMIRNFEKKSGQFQVISDQREWAKLKSEGLYNLLKSYKGKNPHLAKNVLLKMAQKKMDHCCNGSYRRQRSKCAITYYYTTR